MQNNLAEEGAVEGVAKKVHYGRCANGELSIQPPFSLKIDSFRGGGAF